MKHECIGSAAATNSADLESLSVVEISFKKPFQRPPRGINTGLGVWGLSLALLFCLCACLSCMCVCVCESILCVEIPV